MKIFKIAILFFLLIPLKMFCTNAPEIPAADTVKNVYLGLGTGINSYNGMLGISIKWRLVKTLYVRGGLGTGSWGWKLSAGIHYDLKPINCWGFCASYSLYSGAPEIHQNLETVQGKNVITKDVLLEYLPTGTINLIASRHWTIKKINFIYLDLGYAIPTVSNIYSVKDKSVITENADAVIHLMQPGGLIIGLGFMFGL